jgi:putative lipoprotein
MFGGRLACVALLAAAANAQQTALVSGTALYRERIAMPPNAVFEATLEDVSDANAVVVLGKLRRENAGQPPYAFAISYEASKVRKSGLYVVRAKVLVDGRPMFQSEGAPVLTRGKRRNVGTVLMRRAAAPGPAGGVPAPLQETYWRLTMLGDQPVAIGDKQKEPHLVFRREGSRVNGNTGCNSTSGTYEVKGESLRFGHMMGTLMACVQGMATENASRKVLGQVRQYRITGERLELQDEAGKTLARLEAVAKP